jgi:UrcA family protein
MNTIIRCNSIRRTLTVALVGSFALGHMTNGAAADQFSVPTANIRYGDLNLATAQGAKTLFERIISASYAVCQSFDHDGFDNADPLALQSCRTKVIADAVTRIGTPALYAVYNARMTKPLPALIVTAQSRQ